MKWNRTVGIVLAIIAIAMAMNLLSDNRSEDVENGIIGGAEGPTYIHVSR